MTNKQRRRAMKHIKRLYHTWVKPEMHLCKKHFPDDELCYTVDIHDTWRWAFSNRLKDGLLNK